MGTAGTSTRLGRRGHSRQAIDSKERSAHNPRAAITHATRAPTAAEAGRPQRGNGVRSALWADAPISKQRGEVRNRARGAHGREKQSACKNPKRTVPQ